MFGRNYKEASISTLYHAVQPGTILTDKVYEDIKKSADRYLYGTRTLTTLLEGMQLTYVSDMLDRIDKQKAAIAAKTAGPTFFEVAKNRIKNDLRPASDLTDVYLNLPEEMHREIHAYLTLPDAINFSSLTRLSDNEVLTRIRHQLMELKNTKKMSALHFPKQEPALFIISSGYTYRRLQEQLERISDAKTQLIANEIPSANAISELCNRQHTHFMLIPITIAVLGMLLALYYHENCEERDYECERDTAQSFFAAMIVPFVLTPFLLPPLVDVYTESQKKKLNQNALCFFQGIKTAKQNREAMTPRIEEVHDAAERLAPRYLK